MQPVQRNFLVARLHHFQGQSYEDEDLKPRREPHCLQVRRTVEIARGLLNVWYRHAVAVVRPADLHRPPADLQRHSHVATDACDLPGRHLQRRALKQSQATQSRSQDALDLLPGVRPEHDPLTSQARADAGEEPLGQVHGVCDADHDQARLLSRRPLEQVVQHGLLLRHHEIQLVHQQDRREFAVVLAIKEDLQLHSCCLWTCPISAASCLRPSVGEVWDVLAVDRVGLAKLHPIHLHKQKIRRVSLLALSDLAAAARFRVQLRHELAQGCRLAGPRHAADIEGAGRAHALQAAAEEGLDRLFLLFATQQREGQRGGRVQGRLGAVIGVCWGF
eukprot:scaffold2324_cov266-Pinguiococcus_pyrenoidosus.AAC.8